MNRTFKTISLIAILVIAGGSVIAYFMWNKPKRNVTNEAGIAIAASQLVKDFQANEIEANKKYLDKAIQVSGVVSEVKNNQEGKVTIMLASDDAFTGVFCTLKEQATDVKPGASIAIKGICSGMLTDVRLREAVIVK